jgi:hypothetical protein
MNLADELSKLQQLHQNGALTDEEYARAKDAVLARAEESSPDERSAVQRQLDQMQRQQALLRLDQDWDRERASYLMRGKHGQFYPPSKFLSVAVGIFVAIFGIIWTMGTLSLGAPGFFPFFGVFFVLLAIGVSIYNYKRAEAYEQAEARYRQRRAEMLDADARWQEDRTP